jgi:thiamine-phosphate pyrophosphorylase
VTVLVLTDRRQARRPLADTVAAAVEGGARAVVLREKDLPRARRAALAERLRAILVPAGGRLIVAGTDPLGGDAVHLAAADPVPAVAHIGRSCHDAGELARASTVDAVDYVTLSPVFPSASKPGYGPVLGTDGLRALVAGTPVKVFALGGVTTGEQAAACRAAGAVGVAVMGVVMRAADPAAVVRELL